MEQSTGKIGLKEYIALVVIMISPKVADDTPAILFEKLYNAAWMTPLFNGIVVIIPIYLLFQLVVNSDKKDLFEVIKMLFGKFFSSIIVFLLWIILFFALIIDTAIYTDIIGTMYFIRTPTIIIYSVLMVICAYGAKRGFEQIGSVAWLSFPYIQFAFFIALLLTLGQGNANFLFPLFGPGAVEVIKESSLKLSIYGDFLYLFFILPFVKSTKTFKKGTWIALIIISTNMVIGMMSYVFLFDYNTVMQLNYPFHEVIRTISVGFLANLETFFFPFWIIASIIRFVAYLFICSLLFGHLLQIKHFEYIIPTLATLIVIIGIIPESPSEAIFVFREGILWIATPVCFLLPCLMWIIAKFKGVLKNE